ncbi:hypothetical protein FSP39_003870 [Pinctada imbricata]|uniref:GPI ethanolamine phosphate transferase 2 C-terminal domain-containing protein n=1 Tax=Pinctada imbricata TaxID=66713 RepID=A0AA89BNH8_PINIB|nr:hypothetical protein FSP39_003870 [Pinctada imbricata]
MRGSGRHVVFYGDDTWLNLFPAHFSRQEGTTSFFVTDYTEVDDNVTRHLDIELKNGDFDLMILHYLGLDHIGHIAGPSSPLIGPKLQEMDRIIEKIHSHLRKLQSKDSLPNLLIVCGDHGMSDQGGHGGASDSEIKVPVMFLSTRSVVNEVEWRYEEIQQTDLCATLSVLLGVPIPQNNVGKVLTDLLYNHNVEQKVQIIQENTLQILKVFQHNVGKFEEDRAYSLYQRAAKSHSHWLGHLRSNISEPAWNLQGEKIIQQYKDSMVAMTSKLSTSLTSYDMYALTVIVILIWMVFLALLIECYKPLSHPFVHHQLLMTIAFFLGCVFCHVTICTNGLTHSDVLCSVTSVHSVVVQAVVLSAFSILLPVVIQGLFTLRCNIPVSLLRVDILGVFLVGGTIIHTLSLLSSSFVEEEHQTWYFLTVTFHLLIMYLVIKSGARVVRAPGSQCHGEYDAMYTEISQDHSVHSQNDSEHNFTRLRSKCSTSDENYEVPLHERSVSERSVSRDSGGVVYTLPKGRLAACVIVLILCRIMRGINQTGNKWLLQPDLGDWLVRPENQLILSALCILSIFVIIVVKHKQLPWKQKSILSISVLTVYLYRVRTGAFFGFGIQKTQGILEARLVFAFIFVFTALEVHRTIFSNSNIFSLQNTPDINSVLAYPSNTAPRSNTVSPSNMESSSNKADVGLTLISSIQCSWVIVMTLLMKPHNILLVGMVTLQEDIIWCDLRCWILQLPVSLRTLYCLWMGQAAFFYQGNSNSLSTVDIAAGYIGLGDFNPIITGILLTLSTYAGPIFWFICSLKFASTTSEIKQGIRSITQESLCSMVHTMLLCAAFVLSVYSTLTVFQRYHLFVWTVFSPKLLYEGMRTVILSAFCFFIFIGSYFLSC